MLSSFTEGFDGNEPLAQQQGCRLLTDKRLVQGGCGACADIMRIGDFINQTAGSFERLLGGRAHRHLPRIEFMPCTAHRHEGDKREAAGFYQRQHVDAVADTG